MKINASVKKKDSTIRPGYMYINTYRPSALLSDTLLLDTLLNETEDTIYFKDTESKFILNNRKHLVQFGVQNQEELIGKSDADLYPKAFADKCRTDELRVMQTGIPLIDSVEQAINSKGEVITFSTCKYPLYDQNGKIVGTWGISRDITKLVQAQEAVAQVNAKLMALSLLDDLSGLYNRRHFDSILKITIDLYARRRIGGLKANFCLVYLDVDHFKQINDTYGHVMGDAVIRYLGGQLLAYTRSSDYAFRYGGDEYALILQDTDLSSGKIIGERLRKLIEKNPPVIESTTIPLTISLGIVEFQDEKTNSELVCKADKKLYEAKSEGRNRLCG